MTTPQGHGMLNPETKTESPDLLKAQTWMTLFSLHLESEDEMDGWMWNEATS